MLRADVTLSQDGAGWTERYHLQPEDKDLRAIADRLALARRGILAAPAYLRFIRVLDLDRPGHPTQVKYNAVGEFPGSTLTRPFTDSRRMAGYSWTCALMCFLTAQGARRTLWLNGIVDTMLKKGELDQPWFIFWHLLSNLRVLRDALSALDLNLHIENLLPDSESPSAIIDGIDTSSSGLYRIKTRADFPAGAYSQVRVMGSRGVNLGRARGLRRIMRIEGPRSFVLDRGPLPELGPIGYTGGAVLRAAVYTFSPAIWEPYGDMALDKVPNKGVTFLPLQLRFTDPLLHEFGIGVRPRGAPQPQKRGRRRAR